MATRHSQFEWDNEKAETNRAKHGVSFEAARSALVADDKAIEEPDDRHEELRINSIVRLGSVCLTVCWTMREGDGVTRIISARRASRQERNRYANRK